MEPQALSPGAVAQRLEQAGVPLARSAPASTLEAVPAAFAEVGADTVVLKAGGLLHKTDEGGVVLDLTTAEKAAAEAGGMLDRIGERALPFVLQEQARGLEMLVGVQRTPQLGAALVVGRGGVHTEIHNDVARALVPVSAVQARGLLRRLRSWPLLDGYRGAAPLDVDALVGVMLRISELAEEDPTIAELDLNPVMVRAKGEGAVVVDARILTAGIDEVGRRSGPNLDRMLRPEHVAVVGVSDDEHKVGARLFRYLVDHDFRGRLDPVHPAGGTVRGHTRSTSLDEVEGSPDLVCVTVPARAVVEVARQAVAVGAGGLLVHSSDFAEVGPEGRAVQDELARICIEGGVPLAGPNNMGIVAPGRNLTASISGGLEMSELVAGTVALLTSSGALGSCLATRLMGTGVGLSYWVHVGNEADLVVADFLEWLVDDPGTSAVGLLLEDIKDGPRFVEAGRALAEAGKPMFALNLVRSEKGRRAALSHTGAMVGSYELREEVLRAAGMVSVPSLRVLEDALLLASSYDLPRGNRLIVVTFSGGACTIIADEAERFGVELPDLSRATRERVRRYLPSFAAVRNPLDVSYQMLSDPENFENAICALLADGEFDAALVQFTTNADPYAARSAQAVINVRDVVDVPVYVSRFGAAQLAPRALEVYGEAGIPVLDAPDRAAHAVSVVMQARRRVGSE